MKKINLIQSNWIRWSNMMPSSLRKPAVDSILQNSQRWKPTYDLLDSKMISPSFWEFNNILKSMQSESCSSFNIETRGLPASNLEGHHRLHASLLRRQVWSLSGKGYKYIKYYNNMTGKFERSETSCTSLLYMLICVYSHWSIANKLLLLKHLNYHGEIELKNWFLS